MDILLVEDNARQARALEAALVGRHLPGAKVHVAARLGDALGLLRSHRYDGILLDLTLPDSDGAETLSKVMASRGQAAIVILTGTDDEELALRAVHDGVQEYLVKGTVHPREIARVLRHAVERGRMTAALASSERFLRATLDALSGRVAILDEVGTILNVNLAWQQFAADNVLGVEAAGVGGNYLDACDGVTGAGAAEARAAAAGIREVLQGQRPEFYLEYACHSPDDERWFAVRVTRFQGCEPVRFVVVHEDVTARKRAELLDRERLGLRDAVTGMEQVLGVVGHELRTPLASLRALSEFLLLDGARGTPEWDRFVRGIGAEVDRMAETVNNLLEAARLDSGRARWNWSRVNLHEICEDAVDTIQALTDPGRVRLAVTATPAAAEHPAMGDADALRRLILNLLSNARKHTTDGTICVSVNAGGEDGPGWVEIRVSDTGAGIPPEILDRLGQAFALNSGVVGRNHIGGAGLGLSICKAIAAAHGGWLRVTSTPGRGTTIAARLRTDLAGPVISSEACDLKVA